MDLREQRAFEMLDNGKIPQLVDKETFIVPSQTSDKKYTVRNKSYWLCDCLDFRHRHKVCKHILAVRLWVKLRNKTEPDEETDELKNQLLEENKKIFDCCPYCKSKNYIKRGYRKTECGSKQRLFCKDCKKYFVLDPVKKHKGNGQIVTLTMDLFYKGLSLRDIQDTIRQFFGIEVHHETIRRWINKFTNEINKYVSKFEPKTGLQWQIDEQIIQSKKDNSYCWNIIDKETKFLLASNITRGRETEDAKRVLKKVKKTTEKQPLIIQSDGMRSYKKAIKDELPESYHARIGGIPQKSYSYELERYHGTFREFDKVRRGFKSDKTAMNLVNNFKTYYNFLRPHTSLNRLTPAEASEIKLNLGQNKWLGLIKKSMN